MVKFCKALVFTSIGVLIGWNTIHLSDCEPTAKTYNEPQETPIFVSDISNEKIRRSTVAYWKKLEELEKQRTGKNGV